MVAERAASWDAILISGPHPIGQMIARQCAALGVVVVPLVRQNLVEQMAAHGNPLMRLLSMTAAGLLEWDFRRMSRDRLVLTVGAEMMEAYARHSPRVHNHFPCLIDDGKFQFFSTLKGGADPTRLLCVCRLAPEKGHRFLFDALKKLKDEGLTCHLDIVGDGELEAELKTYVLSAGLERQVEFHGYVAYGPKLFGLYDSAGIMVLPSLTEGFPQVINESLSVGLPTIASAVGGIPSFLTQGRTGIMVPPGNVGALAEAIEGLVRDDRLREALRRNGRELMRANTLEANRAGVLRAVREEVERARRPPSMHAPARLVPTGEGNR
jgi:glycosyltransferase involved in cell wall biosynthesis